MGITAYRKSRAESDQYIDQAMQIIARVMIRVGTEDEDNNHATDIVVEPGRYALRTRTMYVNGNDYFKRYHREFTIRSKRPSGVKTELEKILDGDGEYYLYGWVNSTGIKYYTIFDLNVFRQTISDRPQLLNNTTTGKDGVTFTCFKYEDFSSDFIIDSNLPGLSYDDVTDQVVFENAA